MINALSRTGAALTFPSAIVRALKKNTTGLRELDLNVESKRVRLHLDDRRSMAHTHLSSTLTLSVRMNDISSCIGCNARSSK